MTVLTIARERGWSLAVTIAVRQLAAAVVCAALLGWGVRALGV